MTLCDEITAMGYDLSYCKYADNFDATINNGAESFFEVQYSGSTEYDFWGGDNPQSSWLSTFMGPRNSGMVPALMDGTCLRKNLSSQYESGDLRKDMTVFIRDVLLLTVWNTNALSPIRDTTYASSLCRKPFLRNIIPIPNFVVYRYADVLLKKAEALNELGHPTRLPYL